jgi:hypothetical protein
MEIITQKPEEQTLLMNLFSYQRGMYFMQITTTNGTAIKKITLE